MSAQRLDRVLKCYRIGDPAGAYPIFDATGSRIHPGRWNGPSCAVLYASEHYSTAMLEKLVRGSGRVPPNQHFIEITIPNGLSYETFDERACPGWDAPTPTSSRELGDGWQRSRRSLLFIVPSVVARVDHNFLLNPEHPDFHRVTRSLHRPVWWDPRLFP